MIRRGWGICAAIASTFALILFISVRSFHYNGVLLPSGTIKSSIPSNIKSLHAATDDDAEYGTIEDDVHEHDGEVGTNKLSAASEQLITYQEEEIDLGNGFSRFDRRRFGSMPEIMVLVLTKDNTSWGYNLDAPPRHFEDFLKLLYDTSLEPQSISLGLLTSDKNEYELFKSRTESIGFARLSVFLHPGYSEEVSREDRHKDEYQANRRREIARIRNYLMFNALENEPHTVWMDADVQLLDDGIIQKMVSHTSNPEVGIITARCEIGPLPDYDGNAFAFTNNERYPILTQDQRQQNADPTRRNVTLRVNDLIQGTTNDDIVALDSVGGTVLYMRSSLIKQGLAYTYQYVIGTTWEKEGWDGMETEGMCFRAQPLGAKCFTLGGSWKIRHTDR